jgi:hypothetical protein
MGMEETPRLERFDVVKYTSDHDRFDEGGTSVIGNFYKSFSTLRHIVFDVRRTQDNSFEAECLMSHVELKTCYLNVGLSSIPNDIDRVRTIRTNNIHVTSFTSQLDLSSDFVRGAMSLMAAEMVQFENLEEWEIIYTYRTNKPTSEVCEKLVEYIYACCIVASANCKTNKIGLDVRRNYYSQDELEAGDVPTSHAFCFV